jgi:hypothetical protein
VDELDRDGEGDQLSSQWVIQVPPIGWGSPIVGILCEDHKHKLLTLLTFLVEECWIEVMAALSKCGTKVRRDSRI